MVKISVIRIWSLFFLEGRGGMCWGGGEPHETTCEKKEIFLHLDIDINLFVIVFNLWYNLYSLISMNPVKRKRSLWCV